MSPRTTGILVLLAAALAAFVYFYEVKGQDARTEAEEHAKRLFADVEPNAIGWFEVTLPGSPPTRVERRDAKWQLVAPLDFPADAAAADALASTLATLASESELENPQPPDEYGLGADAKLVRFGVGEQEHTLKLGNDTPLGGAAYASVGDKIYTVARFKAASLAKTAADLRDKRVLAFESDAVRRIEASWPGGRVVLEREEAKKEETPAPAAPEASQWRLVEPIQGRADADTVADLLSDLGFLAGDGFVDDPPPDAEAGLAPPDFEVVLTAPGAGEGAAPQVTRMAISKLHDDVRWVRGSAANALYIVPKVRIEEFPRTVAAYRWKQVARFPLEDAKAIDFFFQPPSGDPVAIHAEHGGSAWTSTPESFAEGKIDAALAALSHLRGQDVLADHPDEAQLRKLGLVPPNVIVTVFGAKPEGEAKEGEETKPAPILAEVQIGNVEGSEWIAARAAGDPAVYQLPYSLAEQLPVSLDAFRNRFEAAEAEEAKPAEEAAPATEEQDFPAPSEESP